MLTVSRSDEDLFAALRAGASGYLLKDMPFDALGDELAGVLEGRVAMPPELVARLVEEFRDSAPRRRALLGQGAGAQLTSREWQVLDFLRQGLATNEIARRLFVSPATVRSHVAAVLRKLRVPDREAAIALFEEPYEGLNVNPAGWEAGAGRGWIGVVRSGKCSARALAPAHPLHPAAVDVRAASSPRATSTARRGPGSRRTGRGAGCR